ncbi:hypothetical protein [Methylobacterium isbiliense]|jgi:hypothetical protein|uniref:Uncharacterized protein n=1 Tax=Methylobacterium isbiliense TaxID=315478 RepID=A0ABQ4SNL4_9HYPH|nr:hypothetical protein [Methylobacterium isbiliense]MDN3623437.1 hypothetical protein [Methylobacterium isbiliense]GJE04114.1 hypothetical protein GMJLKIPL_6074 [Methylobacterium isbiliense]
MKWLVTAERRLDAQNLGKALEQAGAHVVDEQTATPLGEGERVWEVEGPPNLDAKLTGVKAITGVFPSSTMTLY